MTGKAVLMILHRLERLSEEQMVVFLEAMPAAPRIFRKMATLARHLIGDSGIPRACEGLHGDEFDEKFLDAVLALDKLSQMTATRAMIRGMAVRKEES